MIEEVAGPEMAAFGYLDHAPVRRRRTAADVRERLSARLRRIRRLAPLAFGAD